MKLKCPNLLKPLHTIIQKHVDPLTLRVIQFHSFQYETPCMYNLSVRYSGSTIIMHLIIVFIVQDIQFYMFRNKRLCPSRALSQFFSSAQSVYAITKNSRQNTEQMHYVFNPSRHYPKLCSAMQRKSKKAQKSKDFPS